MKLKEYIESLQKIHEEKGELDLIYSSGDDEGNDFYKVSCSPSLQYFDEKEFEVIHENDLEEYNPLKVKLVVCIN